MYADSLKYSCGLLPIKIRNKDIEDAVFFLLNTAMEAPAAQAFINRDCTPID
jgi:hypothetical protein